MGKKGMEKVTMSVRVSPECAFIWHFVARKANAKTDEIIEMIAFALKQGKIALKDVMPEEIEKECESIAKI